MFSPEITFTYTLFTSAFLYFNAGYREKIVIVHNCCQRENYD